VNEQLVEKFFEDGVPENVKNRVIDVLVLPDFSSDDEALKIRVIVDELIPNSLIENAGTFPSSFDGYPVEVFDSTPVYPAMNKETRRSPGARYHEILRPGIACGGRGTTNGTLGAIVFDLKNGGAPCVLSNYHVLRGKPLLFRGRTNDVFQPGKLIGGTPSKNVIANFQRSAGQNIDAAIATLNLTRTFEPTVFPTNVQFLGPRIPKIGDILEKSGSRTGVTRAEVASVSNKRVQLVPVGGDRYDAPEISMSGDSGSVWYYPETGEAAVLHAYGDDDGASNVETAGGYLMTRVIEALNISLLPPTNNNST